MFNLRISFLPILLNHLSALFCYSLFLLLLIRSDCRVFYRTFCYCDDYIFFSHSAFVGQGSKEQTADGKDGLDDHFFSLLFIHLVLCLRENHFDRSKIALEFPQQQHEHNYKIKNAQKERYKRDFARMLFFLHFSIKYRKILCLTKRKEYEKYNKKRSNQMDECFGLVATGQSNQFK